MFSSFEPAVVVFVTTALERILTTTPTVPETNYCSILFENLVCSFNKKSWIQTYQKKRRFYIFIFRLIIYTYKIYIPGIIMHI